MTGINNPFTGSWLDHDQGRYAQWVDRQANVRAVKQAAAERRARDRARRPGRARGATAPYPSALREG